MNKDVKNIVSLYVGAALAYVVYREVTKEERAKRVRIREESAKEVDAINRAASVIVDRIRRGYYNGKTLEEIQQEFEFEQVAQHSDMRDIAHS